MRFESNVIYIGTKTPKSRGRLLDMFESNVIYIGTKTRTAPNKHHVLFESNVIYIGTKTKERIKALKLGLRVM